MPRELSPDKALVRKWILSKPGILTEIAAEFTVTPQFVQRLAYGYATARPGHPIEQRMKEKGWPGIMHRPKRARRK